MVWVITLLLVVCALLWTLTGRISSVVANIELMRHERREATERRTRDEQIVRLCPHISYGRTLRQLREWWAVQERCDKYYEDREIVANFIARARPRVS